MFKRTFTCPTCEKEFEREVTGDLVGGVACIRYCSVTCNPMDRPDLVEKTCACGKVFMATERGTQCNICRLPPALQTALERINEQFSKEIEEEG